MKVASVFMGSLIFPWNDMYVFACVRVSHPNFFLFSTTLSCYCCRFIYLYRHRLVVLSYFSIHLFIYFGLYLFYGVYFLICLPDCLACVCEHFIPHYFHLVIICFHSYHFVTHYICFALCLLVCAWISVYKMSFMSTETKMTIATAATAAATAVTE